MLVLGLNLFHADSSAALIKDGDVVYAVAEERFNRVKHYGGFPKLAIKACLDHVGASIGDVDHVAVGRNKDANVSRKLQYALSNPAKMLNLLSIRKRRESMNDLRTLTAAAMGDDIAKIRFQEHAVEHHLAHIASAFYCSGLEEAAGFSYDGSGDFVTAMFARCKGTEMEVLRRVYVPHSLGSFYNMICEFVGYRQYGDEGKVMGLAALGDDTYYKEVCDMVSANGSTFKVNLDYFRPFGSDQGMSVGEDGTVHLSRHYSDKMIKLFGEPRVPHDTITDRDKNLAYAMQHRFEDIAFHLLNKLHQEVPIDDLVMAGGCALNSVANGKIFSQTPFRRTWIQPASGDEGLAIGAALYAYHATLKQPRKYAMKNAYLGPEYSEERIREALDAAKLEYRRLEREQFLEAVADQIADGKVVGWFQGRMEWGPRALGNRSILAHPGLPDMKDILNARIKHREWFRPFAPSILAEHQTEYFEHGHPTPFMLHVYKIRPEHRQRLCAVNHVDDTGRLQTVTREENPLYYDLISAFHRKTGIPVVLNTSFNENEPIVCQPEEAIDCFCRTKMDVLAIGPYLVLKGNEPS
jgi:carbamoyltransferase